MKRKATYKDIPDYYNEVRYGRPDNKGYMYYLCNKLTEEDKTALQAQYNNIGFYTAVSQYAPEHKTQCIMIYDRVQKGGEV